jgi:hypothetical protein
MPTPEPLTARTVHDASVTDLLTGIVSDTGDIISAHVDDLREEVKAGVTDLKTRAMYGGIMAVAALGALIAVIIALDVTLIALGLPAWLACWLVVLLAGLGAFLALRGTRSHLAKNHGPGAALGRAKREGAWLAHQVTDTVTDIKQHRSQP